MALAANQGREQFVFQYQTQKVVDIAVADQNAAVLRAENLGFGLGDGEAAGQMGDRHPRGHDVDGFHIVKPKHPENHFGFVGFDNALLVANGSHQLNFSFVSDGALARGHKGVGDFFEQPHNWGKCPGQGSHWDGHQQGNGDGIALSKGFGQNFAYHNH